MPSPLLRAVRNHGDIAVLAPGLQRRCDMRYFGNLWRCEVTENMVIGLSQRLSSMVTPLAKRSGIPSQVSVL